MQNMKPPIIARSRRGSPILICKKCLKRCEGGGRIRGRLKDELNRRCEAGAPSKPARLVAVNCFGICPKRAVVLASGHSLQRNEYVLVSRPRQVDEALEKLQPPASAASTPTPAQRSRSS